jgi:hypothetical protein
MPDLYIRARDIIDDVSARADEYSGVVGSAKEFISETFGQSGLIACYVILTVLSVLLISKVARLAFSAVKFLVIPSLALAFLAALVLKVPFATALPVTVTGCSLFLLFKG